MGNSELSGLVALVTGASRGIGHAVARTLAERGVSLMLVGRDTQRLSGVAEELSAESCAADLSEPAAPAAVVAAVSKRFGRLDILVNNAGIAEPARLEDTGIELWDRHMAINARAPFLLSTEALPLLRASSRPRIVNIGSVVAHRGYAEQGAYTASKHALYGLTKVLAKELHGEGIRVHFIAPGGVATDMIGGIRPDLDPGTLIEPAEIAGAVCFLLEQGTSGAIDELSVRRDGSEPWK